MAAPRIALLAAALVFAAEGDLHAQRKPLLAPGARVRVSAPTIPGDRLEGTVERVDADTLVVRLDGRRGAVAVPYGSITALDMSRGRKSRALQFGGIGAAAGAVAGAAILLLTDEGTSVPAIRITGDESLTEMVARPVWEKVRIVVASTAIGGVVGAVVGAALPVERWQAVPLQGLRMSVTPQAGLGLTVSGSLSF